VAATSTIVGPQGSIGLTGATGPTGPTGADGADGADGEDGANAELLLFKTFLTNESVNGGFTVRSVFNTTPVINTGAFTLTASAITIPSTGIYQISFNCYFTGNSGRTNVGVSVSVNGERQPERSASDYIRNRNGHNESSTHFSAIYNLSSGDEVGLGFFRLANSGTVTLDGSESSINIIKVG
jgi:hypothetical protein